VDPRQKKHPQLTKNRRVQIGKSMDASSWGQHWMSISPL